MRRALVPMMLLALLAAAPAAHAARRYAAPNGSLTSAQCAAGNPCRIDRAVNGAAPGDEVIVTAGVYTLAVPLKPSAAIALHGDPDRIAPRIVAPSSLKVTPLTLNGGTVTHVSIQSDVKDKPAVQLEAGVADGILVASSEADGAVIVASSAGTVLRNSVVRTSDPRGGAAALKLNDDGKSAHVDVRNVTAMATAGSATGIRCEVKESTASVLSTLVRGQGLDIDANDQCTVAYSNFRPAFSTGVGAGTGNQSAEPRFADGDYRPAAGSPTIDAGALDAFASSPDPDGRPRKLGAAPDIGAYEYAPPATGPADAPSLRGVPAPRQGRTVVVAAERGTIRVREPGAARFTVLDQPGRIPVGSVVDARHGRVQLASAIAGGRIQVGLFWAARFKITQARRGAGMTTLALRGGRVCGARSALAVASRKHRRKHRRRRRLWARDDGGLYRTRGNDSVATAHGTAWLTKDRCGGTLTRVTKGAVAVRDLVRHKRVLVKAGHSYFARAAKR